jgi:ribonuclease Z
MLPRQDFVVFLCTFCFADYTVAAEKFHSTAREAGLIAKKAGVHKLIIGHFSNRYETISELVDEAATEFANVEAAEDGKVFEIS